MVISQCVICGSETRVQPSQLKRGGGKTCSVICKNKYARSKRDVSGNKNPAWKGGRHSDHANYAEHRKLWRENNPEAYKAHAKVDWAVRSGKLKRGVCAVCGCNDNIQAHHSDYTQPLLVTWLCSSCHRKQHATGQHPMLYNVVVANPQADAAVCERDEGLG